MTKQSAWQLFKFIMMGSLAALVHFCVLYVAVAHFGIKPVWANVIAFFIAFIASFLGHLNVTFRSEAHEGKIASRLSKWLISSVAGFVLNQGLFMLGLAWLGDAYYLLIWFVVTGIVTISSFLLGKLWAFKP